MTEPDPDAVIVWFPVAPVGKGLRDQQRHAFGAGWVAAACTLAEGGEDPATIEVPTVCLKVFKLAEILGEGDGAPCELCLSVVPLQSVAEPEDMSGRPLAIEAPAADA